ncbi:hypothetical protein QJQ45_021778 [Haematococcus lacustris]|nr:hypothetical protein QJQ45_021778 [Haematococcus lacustris]
MEAGGGATANPLGQLNQSQAAPPLALGSVGVGGLVRREAARTEEAGRVLGAGLQDLQALMSLAADLVQLAERFRGVSRAQGGPVGSEADELVDEDTQAQLIALGITSPVTRESAGARYHLELSRQLADFLLAGPLKRAGDLLPLPDVYCLFNRARGTELVSPDDLLAAVKLFGQARLPLSLRTFPSGFIAVQGAAHSDDAVCATLGRMAQPVKLAPGDGDTSAVPSLHATLGPPLTAVDVARELGCATAVAREHLVLAEARGILCRDEGPEGLRFFRNFFRDAAVLAG